MKYTVTQLIPTWYQAAEKNVSSETINFRIASIENISEDEDLESDFWLNLFYIHLGVKKLINDGLKSKFITHFSDIDETGFPLERNDNIIKVLAAITLVFKLEVKDYISDIIALAISNSIFYGHLKSEEFTYLFERAQIYLSNSHIEFEISKTQNLISDVTNIKNSGYTELDGDTTETVADFRNSEMITVLDSLSAALSVNIELSNELNVLWWILGGYSKYGKKSFAKVGVNKMVFFSALELYNINKSGIGFIKKFEFLLKVLNTSNNSKDLKESSVFDLVTLLTEEEREIILEDLNDTNAIICPIISSLKLVDELGKNSDWEPSFNKKSLGGDIKQKKSLVEISLQFYNELLLQNNDL